MAPRCLAGHRCDVERLLRAADARSDRRIDLRTSPSAARHALMPLLELATDGLMRWRARRPGGPERLPWYLPGEERARLADDGAPCPVPRSALVDRVPAGGCCAVRVCLGYVDPADDAAARDDWYSHR